MTPKRKSPWIERDDLIKNISSFVRNNSDYFKNNAKRMSDLVEMSVYNEVLRYYKGLKYKVSVNRLGRNGNFRYKLSPNGLQQNFSYFSATRSQRGQIIDSVEIYHNVKIQSSHDNHIYYTADISVVQPEGVITEEQKNKRRHSYIGNEALITFFEVKHLNPFPEILLSFNGIVLEVLPEFITRKVALDKNGPHLTPAIVFTGLGSQFAQDMANKLTHRYGINIIRGLTSNKGKIPTFNGLNRFQGRHT